MNPLTVCSWGSSISQPQCAGGDGDRDDGRAGDDQGGDPQQRAPGAAITVGVVDRLCVAHRWAGVIR